MAEIITEDLHILDSSITISNTDLITYLEGEFPTKTFVNVEKPMVEYNGDTYSMRSFKVSMIFTTKPTIQEITDSIKEQIRELVEPFDAVMVYMCKIDMIGLADGIVLGGIFRGHIE